MRGLIDRITNRDVVASLRESLEERDASLQELGEKADKLASVINVLKMRFDMLVPMAPLSSEEGKDESGQRPDVR